MICRAEGILNENVYIGGHYIYPGYIIKGDVKNMMIEAGINIMGPRYIQAIEQFVEDRARLDYLLLTQSHYDHLGAVSYLKSKIPSLRIGAYARVGEILKKESIIKNMNFLSRQLGQYFKDIIEDVHEDVQIRSVDIDMSLKEGDIIDLGGVSCEIFETPGHTRDHLSFYLPEMEILFAGEALGNPAGDGREVKVEFVSSYSDYVKSIEKLMLIKPAILAMSHMYYYTDDDVPIFMENSYRSTLEYRQLIEMYLNDAAGDIESTKELMVKKEYDEKGNILMERNAYIANLGAQIKAVAADVAAA